MVVHHPKNIYKESERRRSSSSSCQHPKLTTNSTVAMSDWMMNGETDSYGVTDWWFICFFLSHRVSLPLPHKYTSIPFTSQWLSLWLRWLLFVCIICVVCVLCLLSVSSFTTKRHHKRCYYFSYFTRNKACVNRRERGKFPFCYVFWWVHECMWLNWCVSSAYLTMMMWMMRMMWQKVEKIKSNLLANQEGRDKRDLDYTSRVRRRTKKDTRVTWIHIYFDNVFILE